MNTPPTRLLMGPGPSNPHPDVTAALAAPLVGHLDPYFLRVMDRTMADLRTVFGTANHHTIPISATGSAGLETIMTNLIEPGDEVVVGVIGYFGQRLAAMAEKAGATLRRLEAPLGEVIDPAQLDDTLRTRPAKLAAFVHAETSTGACQPLADLSAICRNHDTLLAVDCVTSLGGMPVDVDATGIDAAGSCSQKCLGAPPGLGPITVSARAMAAVQARAQPVTSWYFDLDLVFQYWGESGNAGRVFHHTAPVANLYAFHRALELALDEGLETRYQRHRDAHAHLVTGLECLGLDLFTPAPHRLPMLNVVNIPDGVEDQAVRSALLDRGVEISAGFGPLHGKAWRIGLMGYNADPARIDVLLGALDEVLVAQRGAPV